MIPPPMPVPIVSRRTLFFPIPAPNFASPHAAALASFSITTDLPMRRVSSSSRLTPFHPAIFGVASIVCRSDETNPAAETPIDWTEYSAINSLATSAIAWFSNAPPSRGVSRRALLSTLPDSSTTPPRTFVPPTSTPIV